MVVVTAYVSTVLYIHVSTVYEWSTNGPKTYWSRTEIIRTIYNIMISDLRSRNHPIFHIRCFWEQSFQMNGHMNSVSLCNCGDFSVKLHGYTSRWQVTNWCNFTESIILWTDTVKNTYSHTLLSRYLCWISNYFAASKNNVLYSMNVYSINMPCCPYNMTYQRH